MAIIEISRARFDYELITIKIDPLEWQIVPLRKYQVISKIDKCLLQSDNLHESVCNLKTQNRKG
jgi:hypothetical protein